MTCRAVCLMVLALAGAPVLAQDAAPGPATTPTGTEPAVQLDEAVSADVRAVFEGLNLPQVIEVTSAEGRETSETLAQSIFAPGAAPTDWETALDLLYDPERMQREVLASLADALQGDDVATMRAFLESEPGRSLMDLELAARRAMMDEDTEQAAREAAAVAMANPSPRLDLLREYVQVNDLVELNVAGTLNSNYAYASALLDSGALGRDMTDADLLTDIWGQEAEIRAGTVEWVYAFLLKAYEPASDAEIQSLIDFSRTEAGQAMNRAIFAAFDAHFREISRALGLTVGRYMTTREL